MLALLTTSYGSNKITAQRSARHGTLMHRLKPTEIKFQLTSIIIFNESTMVAPFGSIICNLLVWIWFQFSDNARVFVR